MKTKAFSVYDSKAEAFMPPFFMQTVGAAVRAFSDLSNDPNTMVNRHPSDYVLYEIGSFDDDGGTFENLQHVHLGLAADFVEQRPVKYRPAAMESVKMAVENPLATAEEIKNGNQ